MTQALFSASLLAEALPQIWQRDPDHAAESLDGLRRLTRGALAEMRTLLLELRPTALLKTSLPELISQMTEGATGRKRLVVSAVDRKDSGLARRRSCRLLSNRSRRSEQRDQTCPGWPS